MSAVDAQLSFKRCSSLDLTLLDAGNGTVAERVGPSVVTLDTSVAAGGYSLAVSGGRCGFTLTVTVIPTS